MDERLLLVPGGVSRQIFETHFKATFNTEDYSRAQAIFDIIGFMNEKTLATQFHIAAYLDKLSEVLEAYEKLVAEDSWLWLVPSIPQRGAEVKMYADVVYGSVIMDGTNQDIWRLAKIAEEANTPKIFDMMVPPTLLEAN